MLKIRNLDLKYYPWYNDDWHVRKDKAEFYAEFDLYSTVYGTCCKFSFHILDWVNYPESFEIKIYDVQDIQNTLDYILFALKKLYLALGFTENSYLCDVQGDFMFEKNFYIPHTSNNSTKLKEWKKQGKEKFKKQIEDLIINTLDGQEEANCEPFLTPFILSHQKECFELYVDLIRDYLKYPYTYEYDSIRDYIYEHYIKHDPKLTCPDDLYVYKMESIDAFIKDKYKCNQAIMRYYDETLTAKEKLDLIFSNWKILSEIFMKLADFNYNEKVVNEKFNTLIAQIENMMNTLNSFEKDNQAFQDTKRFIGDASSQFSEEKIKYIIDNVKKIENTFVKLSTIPTKPDQGIEDESPKVQKEVSKKKRWHLFK